MLLKKLIFLSKNLELELIKIPVIATPVVIFGFLIDFFKNISLLVLRFIDVGFRKMVTIFLKSSRCREAINLQGSSRRREANERQLHRVFHNINNINKR